jgi:hypothetical protein
MLLRKLALLLGVLVSMLTAETASVRAHAPLPAGCSPALVDRPSCVYVPQHAFSGIRTFDTTLLDPARSNYPVPIRVRYAHNVPAGPRPVVILNHGGGATLAGRGTLSAWGNIFAKAGFIVIHPSRMPVPTVTQSMIGACKSNGWPTSAGSCGYYQGWMIYGPQNTNFLISSFPRILSRLRAQDATYVGTLDASRVIVGGWSGGSTIPLANAGAWRQFTPTGPVYTNQKSALPIAFFGYSSMGPAYAGFEGGFQSKSFDGIGLRPFLTITGKGDDHGKTSEARTTAFIRAKPGNKFLSWDTNASILHEHMAHTNCTASALTQLHCGYFESVMMAYLDAVAYGRQLALDWLDSDAYLTLTGGAVELHRR